MESDSPAQGVQLGDNNTQNNTFHGISSPAIVGILLATVTISLLTYFVFLNSDRTDIYQECLGNDCTQIGEVNNYGISLD